MNLFAYAENNPINRTDSFGLYTDIHYRAARAQAKYLKKWKNRTIENPEEFMERVRRKNVQNNPMEDFSRVLSPSGGPPPGINTSCETTFSECYNRCRGFFSLAPCEDPYGITYVYEILNLAGCAGTCAITPCTYDDPVFDKPPWW